MPRDSHELDTLVYEARKAVNGYEKYLLDQIDWRDLAKIMTALKETLEAIENMPLLEAFPQATQTMKYKLVTLPRGTAKLPILDIGYASIILKQGASLKNSQARLIIETDRSFTVHKYHDIRSENRETGREGPVEQWITS